MLRRPCRGSTAHLLGGRRAARGTLGPGTDPSSDPAGDARHIPEDVDPGARLVTARHADDGAGRLVDERATGVPLRDHPAHGASGEVEPPLTEDSLVWTRKVP